jgi:hypothetical protein
MKAENEIEGEGVKLTARNFNTVLMYVVTLGIGLVCMQTFSTANKVSLIEGKQISRTEVETKLERVSEKQDKLTELINNLRIDIAKLSQKPNAPATPNQPDR